jgi:hypothetical protein
MFAPHQQHSAACIAQVQTKVVLLVSGDLFRHIAVQAPRVPLRLFIIIVVIL